MDKDLQDLQNGVIAGLSAFTPLVHEMLERGSADEPLDKLSATVMDGVRALIMTNASIVNKRTEIHKPYMKPEFIRAIGRVKETDKDPGWLYGKVVDVAVTSYKKSKKASRGANREHQPHQPRLRRGPPSNNRAGG